MQPSAEAARTRPGARFAGIRQRLPGGRPPSDRSAVRTTLGIAVIVVLAAASVLLVVAVALQNHAIASRAGQEAGRYTAPPLPTVIPIRANVALLGDETALSDAPGAGSRRRWTSVVADELGVAFTDLAGTGSAYLSAGTGKRTFVAQAQDVPSDSDVVVLFGGVHDAGRSPQAIARAAATALSTAHSRAPGARVIVVGPVALGSASIVDMDSMRRVLRSAASSGDATWIDPIAQGWLPSPAVGVPAETTLSAADQKRVARRMAALLEPVVNQGG